MTSSSADSTIFCVAKIKLNGLHLWSDGSQKITARNGDYYNPKPNALSLVQIQDCPGRTSTCTESCYVHGLEEHAKKTHDKYKHNSQTLRTIVNNPVLAKEWAVFLAKWIRKNAKGGFRWHVSGDIFSWYYSKFIQHVCQESPKVRHWIYTRSFPLISPLIGLSNLTVNLSVDRDNYETAKFYVKRDSLRVCYLTVDGTLPDDLPDGSVIFPGYDLRGRDLKNPTSHSWWQGLSSRHRKMVCPVDFFGKSRSIRCGICTKCIQPKRC